MTVILGLVFYSYWIEARTITVQHVTLKSALIRRRVTIALVSDLHLFGRRILNREKGIGDAVKKALHRENPDVVLLAGDLIDNNSGIPVLDRLLRTIRSSGPSGFYTVLGNHDHYQYNFFHLFSPLFDFVDKEPSDLKALKEVLQKNRVRLLMDEKIQLKVNGNRIWLGGLDYLTFKNKKIPSYHFTERDKSFKILLSHYPDVVRMKGKEWRRFDLVLSGHTHGGQVTFFGYPLISRSRMRRKHIRGASVHEKTVLYVTKGVGVSHYVPVRLFAKPDITMIRLEGNHESR